jgi:hypothetical protein
MVELRGAVLDDVGAAIEGATVDIYDVDTTTPSRADTTTDSSGLWSISHATRGRFDVKVVNGADVVWLRARDRFQVDMLQAESADDTPITGTRSEDAASVQVAILEGDRATEADNDEAYVSLMLGNDADEQTEMARLTWTASDVSDGTEDGQLSVDLMSGGSLVEALSLEVSAAAAQSVFIFPAAAAKVLIGDSSNANSTAGLTINQRAADDHSLTLKSSDVSTGLTSGGDGNDVEVDDFAVFSKSSATLGGLTIQSLAEDGATTTPFRFFSYGGTADTTKTTAARGLFTFFAAEHDGANAQADITANGNVFTVVARVGTANVARLNVDEDGDLYSVTAAQTFDDMDDLALIEAFDRARSGTLKDAVRADFGRLMEINEAALIEAGMLGGPVAEGGMWNLTQTMRVFTGAFRQVSARLREAESKLAALEVANV